MQPNGTGSTLNRVRDGGGLAEAQARLHRSRRIIRRYAASRLMRRRRPTVR